MTELLASIISSSSYLAQTLETRSRLESLESGTVSRLERSSGRAKVRAIPKARVKTANEDS